MLRAGLRTAAAILILIIASCTGCGDEVPVTVAFTVDGMTCESCSSAITKALENVDGVVSAGADHKAGTAGAVVVDHAVSDTELVDTIEGLGYTVTGVERTAIGR
jgi:copper chaperone CopZ